MSSKNLHKHSLPIVSLAVAGLIAAAAIASVVAGASGTDVADALTSPSASIHTTSLTSAQISFNVEATGNQLPDLSAISHAVFIDAALGQYQ